MSCARTAQTYTRYTTDDMRRSHRSDAAAHTPCVCETPMCAVLLWRVVFVVVFHRPSDFFLYLCTQAGISLYTFCVVAQSTDHRPDNHSDGAPSLLTFSFLHYYHNPAAQHQQQWAHLARIDDRTTTAHIAVFDPTLPLLQRC